MPLLHRTALAVALLAAAPLAMAGTDDDQMTVRLVLENSCTIVADDLDFGTTDTLQNDVDAATQVDVTCTGKSPLTISFNVGAGAGATFGSRVMTGPETVNYSLFRDSARTQPLGDGTSSSFTIGGNSDGTTQSFDVYGRVFGGQNPKQAGTYTDTVTATVEF